MTDAAQAADTAVEPSGEQTPPEAQQQATPATPPPFRLKINDAGREEEIDEREFVNRLRAIHGDDGLRNLGNLSAATRRKLTEAGMSKKQIDEAISDLDDEQRAMAVLEKRHGKAKARKMVEDWYARDLEERNLDPREREQRQKLAGLSERERIVAEKEAKWQQQEEERQAAELQPQLGREFTEALKRAGAEGATPLMLARMAAIVEAEVEDARKSRRGISRDDWALIVSDAARSIASKHYDEIAADIPRLPEAKRRAVVQQAIASMPPQQIAELLGEQGVRAFRRWDAERVRAKAAAPVAAQPRPRVSPSEPRERKTVDDWIPEKW
jgi:endonuclease YncB( thermonuclease family)